MNAILASIRSFLGLHPAASQAATSEDDANALWIDTRTPSEYAGGHLAEAINIPHHEISTRIEAVAPDLDQPIRLYCLSGGRSGAAKQTLKHMGYTRAVNEGSYRSVERKRKKSENFQ